MFSERGVWDILKNRLNVKKEQYCGPWQHVKIKGYFQAQLH